MRLVTPTPRLDDQYASSQRHRSATDNARTSAHGSFLPTLQIMEFFHEHDASAPRPSLNARHSRPRA